MNALRSAFQQSEIAEAVGVLSAAANAQRLWIEARRAEKERLRARLERLQSVRAELHP